MASQNGHIVCVTFLMDTLPTAQPVNSVVPTGGVIKPMDRFNSVTMPKWTCHVFVPPRVLDKATFSSKATGPSQRH